MKKGESHINKFPAHWVGVEFFSFSILLEAFTSAGMDELKTRHKLKISVKFILKFIHNWIKRGFVHRKCIKK